MLQGLAQLSTKDGFEMYLFQDRREGAQIKILWTLGKTILTSQFFISKIGQGKVVW